MRSGRERKKKLKKIRDEMRGVGEREIRNERKEEEEEREIRDGIGEREKKKN